MRVTVRCMSQGRFKDRVLEVPQLEARPEELTTDPDLQGFPRLAGDSDCTSSFLERVSVFAP